MNSTEGKDAIYLEHNQIWNAESKAEQVGQCKACDLSFDNDSVILLNAIANKSTLFRKYYSF